MIHPLSSPLIHTLIFSSKRVCHLYIMYHTFYLLCREKQTEKVSVLLHCSDSCFLYFQCIVLRFGAEAGRPWAADQWEAGAVMNAVLFLYLLCKHLCCLNLSSYYCFLFFDSNGKQSRFKDVNDVRMQRQLESINQMYHFTFLKHATKTLNSTSML